MARLIDADKLIERVMGNGLKPITEQIFRKLIDDAPTIDAVSVVRCKECKHRKKNGFCLEHNRYEKNDNGYCSYGERKESE